ncbi:MAG: ACT domain-containing protein [Ruminococcaceae bacterium]|nr:ACT domain-containing protein [Oscillospiraceae bacterium]
MNIEHLPTGIDTMSLIVHTEELDRCREKLVNSLTRLLKPTTLTIEDGLALVAIVGRGMVNAKGTAARIFKSVSDAGINIRMIDQGSSELNIIIGIDEKDYIKAVRAIYSEFCGK